MKKTTPKYSLLLSVFALVCMFSFISTEKAQAVGVADMMLYPFTGTIKTMELCCNGLKLEIKKGQYQSPIEGKFIFEWKNFIPIYQLGWGLYETRQLRIGALLLGDARQGGQCQTIYSYCEYSENVDYSLQQTGVTPEGGSMSNIGGSVGAGA